MIFEHPNYRSYLKAVFADRAARRPAYSVRAFAKQLGLAQSFLAEILRNKKNLSPEGALRIAASLGLNRDETDYFSALVQLEITKDEDVRASILDRIRAFRPQGGVTDLSVDTFKVISDWYHIPILELTYLKDFDFTPENVSRRLGISLTEAEVGIERLLRVELLERVKGKYRKTKNYVLFQSAIPNKAVARFHQHYLDHAKKAVDGLPPAERFGASEIYPLSPDNLARARKILEGAIEQIRTLSEKTPIKTEVYALGVHLFPITKKEGENK